MGDVSELRVSAPMRAGALTFTVASSSQSILDILQHALSDLPAVDPEAGEVECFVVNPSETEGAWDLSGPVVGQMPRLSPASAVTMLVAGVNLASLEAEPGRLHLHAAAAVRAGRAVVLAATRETGKTTTLARLVLRGWGFISDETVSLAPDDPQVRGYAKPLSIKPGGRRHVPELELHAVPSAAWAAENEVVHVPLGAVGGSPVLAAKPRMIALLIRPDRDASTSAQELHPADAVVRLMGETLDAGRFGLTAVLELAQLAAGCRCYELALGPPDSVADLIEQLFEQPDPAEVRVEALPPGQRTNPDVVTVLVGDRAVLHEQPEGRILALDAAATQIWLGLGGWFGSSENDLRGPVVDAFTERLRALGLLRAAAPRSSEGG